MMLPAHGSLDRAMHPDLRIGRGILAPFVAELHGRIALLSQPEPYAGLPAEVAKRVTTTAMIGSLRAEDLDDLVASLPPVDLILGIGGGMTLDAAKYAAWKREIPLVLAPSVVSVDAAVTNTVAVRRDGVVTYEGFIVAQSIVADLTLISAAPARVNRAGVGDLLSIHTALRDWRLGAEAGTILFDPVVGREAEIVLENIYGLADEVAQRTDAALEGILRAYATVNALCLRVGHSGPEEGSEHYLGYRLEALTGRSFIHGELIGLGAVLMSRLQRNAPGRVIEFLDRCGVAWRPADQSLDRATLSEALRGLCSFVRDAGLPHSIIDEADLRPKAVDRLLDGLS